MREEHEKGPKTGQSGIENQTSNVIEFVPIGEEQDFEDIFDCPHCEFISQQVEAGNWDPVKQTLIKPVSPDVA